MIKRFFYSNYIDQFLTHSTNEIVGILSSNNEFDLVKNQQNAWVQEIEILKKILPIYQGRIFFEFSIPRMGRRIDVILIIQNVIFILEFKIGENKFLTSAIDQVWDYALDLKNFHETSHNHLIAPILIASEAQDDAYNLVSLTAHDDKVLIPMKTNANLLSKVINSVLQFSDGENIISDAWLSGRYSPTPSIIEAAMALYNNHSVIEISRSDASAINLSKTSNTISDIIIKSKTNHEKVICFVTGVPGAGKTLVGLDIATKHLDKNNGISSVFLSGNGPLVAILREALTRDKIRRVKENGTNIKKGEVLREVKMFIQNVHHFRDECLTAQDAPPFDHVAIFDEAQRAWDKTQTVNFMRRKKQVQNFSYSEPEFLISCMDRHKDWAVIICLVGGGQEINTGEAGISEWIESLNRSFPQWNIYLSHRLTDSEYDAGKVLEKLKNNKSVFKINDLHLNVSLRSFRAEHLSLLVKQVLDLDNQQASETLQLIRNKYPIVITRDLNKAKKWLKEKARGNERYGLIVSSEAQRLKPHAIDVKTPIDPIHWFLNDKSDVRSSYYLEDVATEFHIQGLELDWACITWDADFRYSKNAWQCFSFVGDRWNNIKKEERKLYLKNSYRVLLTRARQGMIIVVPSGDNEDHTRKTDFYDCTFNYLKEIGFDSI